MALWKRFMMPYNHIFIGPPGKPLPNNSKLREPNNLLKQDWRKPPRKAKGRETA